MMKTTTETETLQIAIPTKDGIFTAFYSDKGLAGLGFPSERAVKQPVAQHLIPAPVRAWHRVTVAALKTVLAGETPKEFPPFDLAGTTAFQQSVWREMLKISPGNTKSYGEIARIIRNPKAVRAVGGACGANPIPVLIPCHRILAANKKLGGFSGGLEWKRKLLTVEGVTV